MSSHWQLPIQEHAPRQVFPSNSSTFLAPPSLLTDQSLQRQVAPSDILPDDVLLSIFDFYVQEDKDNKKTIEAWQSLAHVCRQWRSLVFRSSSRLNLRLVCTPGTPARDRLDVWPALPLLIQGDVVDTSDMSNIISALGRSDHVLQINLAGVRSSQLKELSAAMQEPTPKLIHLELWSHDETMPVIPDSFLGGFVPTLRFLWLARIPFPSLPKLLLSATHLVDLHLWDIPHSGYVSPEAMVTVLSTLKTLESLALKFQSPRSRPDILSPPRIHRSLLPVVTHFWFKGVREYLDEFVACIDTPQLRCLDITLFNDMVFDTPNLIQFITRLSMLNAPENAHISFERGAARVNLSPQTSQTSRYGKLIVEISCVVPDWQLSSVGQICASFVPRLPTLENLYIFEHISLQQDWQDNIDNVQWLELFDLFTNVKNLYLSEVYASGIMSAALLEPFRGLENTRLGPSRRSGEMLPALRNIFLEGLHPSGPQKAIRQFVAEREVNGQPIAISRWDRKTR